MTTRIAPPAVPTPRDTAVRAAPARPLAVPGLARPRSWSVRPLDVAAILVGIGLVIVAMWVRHGGLDQLDSLSGILTGLGQVTALLGAYLALVQLVLMSRTPWLEQVLGMDRLAAAHRWVGFACIWLLVGHGVMTTVGYALADGSSVLAEAWTLLTTYPYVLMATAGFALFVAVAVTSIRAARRRLGYETWFGIHLYAYLAIALAFLHQLAVGADFVDDPIARGFWIGLYVADLRARPRLPRRSADRPLAAPRPARRQRGRGGARRRLDLRHRPRPRPAAGRVRPVLHVALPDPRRLVEGAPVLDLGGTQRTVSAHDRQGPRRLVDRPSATSASARASSSRARTGC